MSLEERFQNMTGNTKVWRAPLAGLASVAMIATMGVAASTANADTVNASNPVDQTDKFSVGVYAADAPYKLATDATGWRALYGNPDSHSAAHRDFYKYGDTFTTDDLRIANPYTAKDDHKVLTGYSYDLDGKNVASNEGVAVKGDTKLYAQSTKAYTVTFQKNFKSAEQIEVAAGQPITAADYFGKSYGSYWDSSLVNYRGITEPAAPAGYVFVGWTLSDNADSEDLYTGQAIEKDTTLYPKFEKFTDAGTAPGTAANQNVAQVELRNAQDGLFDTKYTLADQPFPEFRANPDNKGTEWQAGTDTTPSGKAYDFTQPVENAIRDYGANDLNLWGVTTASDKAWTIIYHFNGTENSAKNHANVNPTNDNEKGFTSSDVKKVTTSDGIAAKPGDPAVKGAEFTAWYQSNNNTPFDFSKSVASQADAQAGSRTVDLYAGWDTENIVPVAYYYNYQTNAGTTSFWNLSSTDLNDGKGQKVVDSHSGKALNYQTAGTSIQVPTGVEDYFQTAADKDHDKYTSRTVTSWNGVLSNAVVSSVTASVSVYANWEGGQSVLLDADGGHWGSVNHTQYASKSDSQKWADVVTTPTRDGYTFLYWEKAQAPLKGAYANLTDGYYYTFDPSSKTGLKKTKNVISDGDRLRAIWASTDNQTVYALHDKYGLTGLNKQDDYALADKLGFSEGPWKTYVDTWYGLQDEFVALNALDGQAKIDAAKALAAKYEAAQAELGKSPSVDPTDPANPFTDVLKGHTPHYSDIIAGYQAGVIKGWDEPNGTVTFRPRIEVVRQDFAAFLYRLAGSPEYTVSAADNKFTDVTPDTPHYKEILWAAKNGYIKGYADGTFAGMATIQRQDAMEMIYRVAGSPKVADADKAFTDSAATPFADSIAWAKAQGITTGYEDGSFGVGRTIIRQDLAAFLNRAAAVLKK
ncbi:S-layer homology domain-containing protein [Bifidobacterium myosotis]|uniref:S-layer homology domain-containing protein n=2 Tax=Bifidobacterium myosotis TaxID=1630166 RepID=A0A5M9ZGF6_9BIFI|nr:S-layer homology domain-containing protein [Bifidobacterium myosotis]